MRSLALGLVCFGLLTGCHRRSPEREEAKVVVAKGPEVRVTDWKRISCSHLDKRCFKKAREMCPNGYVFTKEQAHPTKAKEPKPKKEKDVVVVEGEAPTSNVSATQLPTEDNWDDEMYSKKPGALLVRCTAKTED